MHLPRMLMYRRSAPHLPPPLSPSTFFFFLLRCTSTARGRELKELIRHRLRIFAPSFFLPEQVQNHYHYSLLICSLAVVMGDYGHAGELAHLRSAQQLLHAFSDTPTSVVLLTTALGEMLALLARQQRRIDEVVDSLQQTKEEHTRGLSQISRNFADILHDTISRTTSAIDEVRRHLFKHHNNGTLGVGSPLDAIRTEFRRDISDLRRVVVEQLQDRPTPAVVDENRVESRGELATGMDELRDVAAHQQQLLELLDMRKTLLRNGYTGNPVRDLRRIRSLDTLSKVQLMHQLPCLHVLASAVTSPERHEVSLTASSPMN